MRKALLTALMILCLAACGSTGQQMEHARSRLTEARAMSLTAQIQAGTDSYTLEYAWDGETWTALVIRPELIAGISASMGPGGTDIAYDGAILAVGDLTERGVSPMGALPMILEALDTGTVDSVWTEGELLAGKFIYDDDISVTVWFDGTGTPVAGELTERGIVKATVTMTNVQIKEATSIETTENEDLGGDQPGESGA